ncbi:hypothetical protein BX616_009594 [Lobosporangium transversale]|uniref:BAR domain-domain-containing protein n=1 Tax=Lobosporangium transversale TaxID=64571 RepID=A0A1Y2GQW9_9FUNG|nr:hypothetical protein BCR41DRAFT_395386 [Lobosporangium transversale]KAF9913781.1 hypothetical protein BX616_009594 [Lobosporangium transversale]ORZ19254.1 hypothetical protein BCR41DRAFT_395386 [Lobosporangium transversale]|eukprot:XP_021882422.1 hypothetical protein BCR41DRAFT_395386 [Lobosporangium transversale]
MIKNIGKFKQWTGEKMGKAQKTRMDDDFNALQAETEARRVALDKLDETSQAYLKVLSKQVEGEHKVKGLAIEMFGLSMYSKAQVIQEGSSYRDSLLAMAEAHQAIGSAQNDMIFHFKGSYLECLEKEQERMKEYQALQKKLQSRRLDYDAKLAKVQKAKKEKPEWEEEMQAAKAKYEDTRESMLTTMTSIIDAQDENVYGLKVYYDALLAFARKMVETLEAIPESTFTTSFSPSNGSHSDKITSPSSKRISRQISRETDEDHRSIYSDDQNSSGRSSTSSTSSRNYNNNNNNNTNNKRNSVSISTARHMPAPLDRAASVSDLRRQSTFNNQYQRGSSDLSRSTSFLSTNGTSKNNIPAFSKTNGIVSSTTAASPPRTTKPQKQVRALYNFEATGDGELSLQKGDIIRIIEEIDAGWWEGELVDTNGMRHEGMFPSNYVEEIVPSNDSRPGFGSGSNRRKSSLNSVSSILEPTTTRHYQDEEEAAYHERESPTGSYYEDPEPEPLIEQQHQQSSIPGFTKRAPPPPPARQPNSSATATTTTPLTSTAMAKATPRPVSTIMPHTKAAVGCRAAPPPPPASRRAPPLPVSTSTDTLRHSVILPQGPLTPSVLGGGGGGVSTPGMGYIPKDYFANQNVAATNDMGPCRECNCTEFNPNVFKRGSCNNCFHAH